MLCWPVVIAVLLLIVDICRIYRKWVLVLQHGMLGLWCWDRCSFDHLVLVYRQDDESVAGICPGDLGDDVIDGGVLLQGSILGDGLQLFGDTRLMGLNGQGAIWKRCTHRAVIKDAGVLRQPERNGQVRFHIGSAALNWNH